MANLAYSSTYTIEVIGGANGVKDLAGNALASTLTSTFQTGAAPTGGGQFIVTPFDKIPNFGANPTIVSAISGNWSSTTTWSTGHVPLANEVVSIAAGTTVTYDLTMASADAVKTVVIQAGGKLIFRTDISTTLYVSNFLVLEGGELVVGTQANPVAANVTASIILANKPLDTTNDPEQYGNSLIALGKVTMYGAVKSSFVTLATEPKAGDTTLKLAQIATGWKAGDKLELPDSKQWAANSGPYVPENEEVVVASVSADGLTLTLTTPLQFNHPGAYDGNGVLNFLPEVANRTHNVVVRSESAPGNRGHVMFTYHADIDIRYASFAGLGRTTIDPIDNTTVDSSGAVTHVGTNENDRNPVNFDHLFGPSTIPADGYQYTFLGNAVFCPMPSIRYKWGITITDSHYGLIQDNFIYNWAGSGLVTEQGNESYNVIAHNFSLLGRGEGDRQGSGKPGDEGVGFWFRGTNNYVHDNVAANWVGNQVEAAYGYKFYMYYLNDVNIPKFQGADMSVAGQYVTKPGNAMPILEFARNEVYGVENGLTVWWLNAYGTSPQGGGVSTIKDFRGWNLSRYGFYGYPMSNVVFDGYVIRGDKSVLSNTHEDLIGLWFGDYMTSGLTVRNSDIQGCRVGFIDPYYGGTTTTIQDSYFNNVVNIQVRSIGAPGSGPNGADRSSKSLIIRNVRFGSTASWNLGGWTPENIQMAYDLHDGSSNLVKSDTVFVYDYNGVVGNNFQLFYKEQASTYVVPQTSGNLAAAPVAWLTNQQLWSQYQMAIAGAVATNTTTMSLIDGLIKTI
ncbi:MAG: hypothetical protein HY040_08895 [Planctomycetes bacterium]|nr:hypothetical protein [Planctomycetota bacterium]